MLATKARPVNFFPAVSPATKFVAVYRIVISQFISLGRPCLPRCFLVFNWHNSFHGRFSIVTANSLFRPTPQKRFEEIYQQRWFRKLFSISDRQTKTSYLFENLCEGGQNPCIEPKSAAKIRKNAYVLWIQFWPI